MTISLEIYLEMAICLALKHIHKYLFYIQNLLFLLFAILILQNHRQFQDPLSDAFYLIAIEDEVDKLNWRRVFDNLKGGHHSMIADTIFDSIDEEYSFVPGNGLIELEPFRKLCEMSQHAGPALKHLELHDHHELTTYERFQKSLRQCMNTEIHLCSVKGYAKHTGLTIVVVGLFVDILVLVSIVQL